MNPYNPYEQLPKLLVKLVNAKSKIVLVGPIASQGFCRTAVIHFRGMAVGRALSLYQGFAHVPGFYLCLLLAHTR